MNLTLTSQYLLANVKAFQEALNSNDNYQVMNNMRRFNNF